ncbi:MAG: hypothetical protein COB15_13310 [Flavobacteriales bacterium]|nr:MAG: hypothetical protein COB15_13310 [Flavobacteriales bacterium]
MQYREALNQRCNYNGLIIGNSKATHGIRPSKLDTTGIMFQNLSINGSGPNFYIEWFTEIFDKKIESIEYLIVSVDYSFVSGSGQRKIEQDSEYFNKEIFWNLWNKKTISKNLLVSNMIPITKYRSRMMSINTWVYLVDDYDRGYISVERKNHFDFNKKRRFTEDFILSEKERLNFISLIDLISNADLKLIFVIPPEYNYDNQAYNDYLKFITSFSKDRNIPLFDFNNNRFTISLAKVENFCDFVHLNSKGSQILSSAIKKELYGNKTE